MLIFAPMRKYLREITRLSPKDCLYIVERHKSEFNYPIHSHDDFELNFIQNGKGVRRIVGDSVEEIGDYELTMVVGAGLVHAWEQGSCTEPDVREITIQFSQDLFLGNILDRHQFDSIKNMFERATQGVTFSLQAIMRVYSILDSLATMNDPFEQFLSFMKMLYILSGDTGARTLSSSSFAEAEYTGTDSRRIRKVREHIDKHYAEDLRLDDVAAIAGMSPSAFSRFFKQHTDRNFVDLATPHACWWTRRPAFPRSATPADSTICRTSTAPSRRAGVIPRGTSGRCSNGTGLSYSKKVSLFDNYLLDDAAKMI